MLIRLVIVEPLSHQCSTVSVCVYATVRLSFCFALEAGGGVRPGCLVNHIIDS